MGATVDYNMSNHIWKHSLKGKNRLFTVLMNLTLFDMFKVIFDSLYSSTQPEIVWAKPFVISLRTVLLLLKGHV